MKQAITIICLFTAVFGASVCSAQNKDFDSLRSTIQFSKDDTVTVNRINRLTQFFLNIDDCDSSLKYSTLSATMAERLDYRPGLGRAKLNVGISLRCKGDFANAYNSLLQSNKLAIELENKPLEARSQRNIGSIFLKQNKTSDALENFFKGLALSEEAKDTVEALRNLREISDIFCEDGKFENALPYAKRYEAYSNQPRFHYIRDVSTEQLGYIYKGMKNDSMALHYQLESLRFSADSHDTLGIANSYAQLGEFYASLKKHEEAIAYFVNAEQMYRVIDDTSGIANTFYTRGTVYDEIGKPDQALASYFESLHLSEKLNDNITISDNYLKIGNVYFGLKDYEKALGYYKDHLELSKMLKQPIRLVDSYDQLSKTYDKLGRSAEALDYLRLLITVKDSIDKKKQLDNLVALEARLNFDKAVEDTKIQQARENLKARIKIYSLLGGLIVLLLLAFLLYRNNKQKQKAKNKIEQAFDELKSTQAQLVQSEKMASLGQLTAGIAHEIQNPLNFVNNFSEINTELIDEMRQEIENGNLEEAKNIAINIKENQGKITHHGKRADGIVKGMLHHSRSSSGVKEPTDINNLADEYLRLAYHGLRAKDKSFNAVMKTDFDKSIGSISAIPQDIGRVILNLVTNAFFAVSEKNKLNITGYEPTVTVTTKKLAKYAEILVRDNGNGIPQKVLDKIFQPFFTTKPTGQGTGLGLSLSYDIIKAHGGELKVNTKEGEFAEFVLLLPFSEHNKTVTK